MLSSLRFSLNWPGIRPTLRADPLGPFVEEQQLSAISVQPQLDDEWAMEPCESSGPTSLEINSGQGVLDIQLCIGSRECANHTLYDKAMPA